MSPFCCATKAKIQKFHCRVAIEMSGLRAVEMSAFLLGIQSPFCLRAGRTSGIDRRGRGPDRDESSRARPVEGFVWGSARGAFAEGGGAVVEVDDTSSASAGESNRDFRGRRVDPSIAWAAIESSSRGGVAAEGVGRVPALLQRFWTDAGG